MVIYKTFELLIIIKRLLSEKQQQRSSSSSSLIYFYCYELQKWCSVSVGMLLLCEPHGPHKNLVVVFYACPKIGSRCGFLGWVDPPMC
uniref:Uncharacterized protein n=1 Tax=Lactuca sativa TaxID=4236 RepID=A0A9R1XCV8_LACSA|nr:hypothetical protein LSAT_V11C500235730 [Lactuca sativa]